MHYFGCWDTLPNPNKICALSMVYLPTPSSIKKKQTKWHLIYSEK